MRGWVVCMVMLAILCARSSLAATPDEVQNAIDKAEHYLYAQQKTGNWEKQRGRGKRALVRISDQVGGTTVTAVYALLSAGERSDNPKLAAAIQYLKATEFTGVYTLGMRCQVWRMLLPDDEVKAALRRDGQLLMTRIGADTGMYDANLARPTDPPDHSDSYYGILGVWACARRDGNSNQLLAGR